MKRIASLLGLALAASPVLSFRAEANASPPEPPQQQADPARMMFIAAQNLWDDGRLYEAEKRFREILAKHPKSDVADRTAYYLIDALAKTGRIHEAIAEITSFEKRYPESRWMADVQEKRIALTNKIPADLIKTVIPTPPAPPFSPSVNVQFPERILDVRFKWPAFLHNALESQVSLHQEVLRVFIQNDADSAIDVAVERFKRDPTDPVVVFNLHAIAGSHSNKVVPTLVEFAKTSPSPKVQREATFWLSRTSASTEARTGALVDILLHSDDVETERVAAVGLAELHGARMTRNVAVARGRNQSIAARRSMLNRILAKGGPDQLAQLEGLYQASGDSAELRRSIVSAVGRIADSGAVAFLAGVVAHDVDPSIRRDAKKALEDRVKSQPKSQ